MTTPVDTDRIRAAVSACPGVARVHGRGPNGVSADDVEVEVHVVARYGVPLPDLGARIDRELAPLLGGRTLNLVVDDVVTDDEPEADDESDVRPDDHVPAALPPVPTRPAIEAPAPDAPGAVG